MDYRRLGHLHDEFPHIQRKNIRGQNRRDNRRKTKREVKRYEQRQADRDMAADMNDDHCIICRGTCRNPKEHKPYED
jgi:hypothetical protein